MITTPTPQPAGAEHPTVWGLSPTQLHDRFWAARGVQVVRQGEPSEIVSHAELFLLTDPHTLAIFKIGPLVDQLCWLKPDLLLVRLHDTQEHGYREVVVTDGLGRFVRFHRIYGGSGSRLTRVGLTPSRRVAELWQAAPDSRTAWRQLRQRLERSRRITASVDGSAYDRSDPQQVAHCVRSLTQVWKAPDSTITRARAIGTGVWVDRETQAGPASRFIGPAWVGAGRDDLPEAGIVGPAILWDDPRKRPTVDDLEWQEIEPRPVFERPVHVREPSSFYRVSKRGFDIAFSLFVLMLTLPIYPLVMLAQWLEDGRPFFFTHDRETVGGRRFPCLKFRSMRNDADGIKAELMSRNRADGPQFFIDPDHDPRLTRIGRLLRRTNIDELPQFFNVLLGHMSVVGPRPSPRAENQCCPPWREARLSVRPGVTGLWQVMRTRQAGMDFQEWIKYDIEYVENAGWRLDVAIIWRTFAVLLRWNG